MPKSYSAKREEIGVSESDNNPSLLLLYYQRLPQGCAVSHTDTRVPQPRIQSTTQSAVLQMATVWLVRKSQLKEDCFSFQKEFLSRGQHKRPLLPFNNNKEVTFAPKVYRELQQMRSLHSHSLAIFFIIAYFVFFSLFLKSSIHQTQTQESDYHWRTLFSFFFHSCSCWYGGLMYACVYVLYGRLTALITIKAISFLKNSTPVEEQKQQKLFATKKKVHLDR